MARFRGLLGSGFLGWWAFSIRLRSRSIGSGHLPVRYGSVRGEIKCEMWSTRPCSRNLQTRRAAGLHGPVTQIQHKRMKCIGNDAKHERSCRASATMLVIQDLKNSPKVNLNNPMVDGTYARPHHADPSVSVAFIAKPRLLCDRGFLF